MVTSVNVVDILGFQEKKILNHLFAQNVKVPIGINRE